MTILKTGSSRCASSNHKTIMFLYIAIFIFGLIVGSFLNVVILRYPEYKDLATGRSKCPSCKKEIAFYDLIPVLSYFFLFGRCRHCKKPISIQYPLVEIATGLAFLLLFAIFGLSYILIPWLIFAALLIIIFVFDLKFLEIPEIFSWTALIFAFAIAIFSADFALSSNLLGMLIGGGILAILVGLSSERWMGAGDIKIGMSFGILLGLDRSLVFLFFSFVFGAIVGIILIIFGKKGLKSEVPFAPFLIASGIFTLIYGAQILNIYSNFAII